MIELRHYQLEARDRLRDHLMDSDDNPLIVLPTGAGKSFCIADAVEMLALAGHRIVILSHVKEILEQDAKAIEEYSGRYVSMYSSGTGRKEVGQVTVAGIQSAFRAPWLFLDFDIVIIDEAHLIPENSDSMYRKFLYDIGKHICIGYTATPFRLGYGYIYGKDRIFKKVICDWGSPTHFNKLIEDGFLCKLTTKRTKLEMDTSNIKLIGGDFSEKELSEKFDRLPVTNAAIKEIMAAGINRKQWLIFAIDIDHAEHIAEVLIRSGISTAVVHSKMEEAGFNRDRIVKETKIGKYKCIVNVNILSVGYDNPRIDLIGILRPTNSPVLHVQALGRGSRAHPEKASCLVLDFAGNTSRLGPINDPFIKMKGKGKEGGDPIMKDCPDCDSIVAPAVKICPDCGHKFKFRHGLYGNAITNDVIDDCKPHLVCVDDIFYDINTKVGSPNSVQVTYKCGALKVKEWICIEHRGFAKHKADHWVKFRGGIPCDTASELINISDTLRKPEEILIQRKGKYTTIKDAIFSP